MHASQLQQFSLSRLYMLGKMAKSTAAEPHQLHHPLGYVGVSALIVLRRPSMYVEFIAEEQSVDRMQSACNFAFLCGTHHLLPLHL